MCKINLAIVDDEALIVSLLGSFFKEQSGINVCLTAESGEAFIEDLKEAKVLPEVVLLDLKMKGMSGIDVMEILRRDFPDINAIIMSSHYKQSFTGFMLKTGVAAFIPKGIVSQQLVDIVKEVHHNGFFLMPDQLSVLRNQVSSRAPEPILNENNVLSDREVEILKLICLQKTAKEIGEVLFIAQRTVEGHKNNLFIKTETKNIAGLVIYAIQNKIIEADEIMLH